MLALALASAAARPHEAASPLQCQAAGLRPPIADARARASREPSELHASFTLADAWSDAGCFSEAVNVLQSATALHPENIELQTRLRVAKSLVGEEHFFEDLDRADMQAQLKRAAFRCSSLSDLDACAEAVRLKPDDPDLMVAQGDALMHAKRAADALIRYRHAAVLTPGLPDIGQKIKLAEAEIPANPANAADAHSGAKAARDSGRPRPTFAASNAPAVARRYSNTAPQAQTH